MQLGRTLHDLWHRRLALAGAVVLALLAALWSVDAVRLVPPGLVPRHRHTATATAGALVDARRSAVADAAVPTADMDAIRNRALLIANVMAGAATRTAIAAAAGVPADAIRVASPLTPEWPRPLERPGARAGVTDIARPPGQYRLSIQSNPTAPEITVYATAPDAAAAARLANGAITGTRRYLADLAASEGIPPSRRVLLRRLGTARGVVVDPGAPVGLAVLAFLVVLGTCSAAILAVGRIRAGWRAADVAPPSPRVTG